MSTNTRDMDDAEIAEAVLSTTDERERPAEPETGRTVVCMDPYHREPVTQAATVCPTCRGGWRHGRARLTPAAPSPREEARERIDSMLLDFFADWVSDSQEFRIFKREKGEPWFPTHDTLNVLHRENVRDALLREALENGRDDFVAELRALLAAPPSEPVREGLLKRIDEALCAAERAAQQRLMGHMADHLREAYHHATTLAAPAAPSPERERLTPQRVAEALRVNVQDAQSNGDEVRVRMTVEQGQVILDALAEAASTPEREPPGHTDLMVSPESVPDYDPLVHFGIGVREALDARINDALLRLEARSRGQTHYEGCERHHSDCELHALLTDVGVELRALAASEPSAAPDVRERAEDLLAFLETVPADLAFGPRQRQAERKMERLRAALAHTGGATDQLPVNSPEIDRSEPSAVPDATEGT